MNKVNFVIFSESAFFNQNNQLNIINVFDVLKTDGFPALYSKLSVTTSINSSKDFKQKLIIRKDNSFETIFDNESNIKVNRGSEAANVVTNIEGLPFFEAGKYIAEVYIDDELQDTKSSIKVELNK